MENPVGGSFLENLKKTNTGILYICPTPIGNLKDITLRALDILEESDLIAAEDTRVTLKLLNHYDIKTPLISFHEHNRNQRIPELISKLKENKDIALVSDAGTPGISDPGEELVKGAIKENIKIVPLPGATAAICALVASGISCRRFVFEGFLPRKPRELEEYLLNLKDEERTLIIYESPHRIKSSLKVLKKYFGNRKITIAREMTKIYEEFIRGRIDEVESFFKKNPPRGEMVLIIEGANETTNEENDRISPEERNRILEKRVEEYEKAGFKKNRALKKAAKDVGISRNDAYEILYVNKKRRD